MQPKWKPVSTEERLSVEAVIRQARKSLSGAGHDSVLNDRFPFALHHEFYRSRLRIGGRKPRHSEIAALLQEWADQSGNFASRYAWQAVFGAAAALNITSLPPDMIEPMEDISEQGFYGWAIMKLALESSPGRETGEVAP